MIMIMIWYNTDVQFHPPWHLWETQVSNPDMLVGFLSPSLLYHIMHVVKSSELVSPVVKSWNICVKRNYSSNNIIYRICVIVYVRSLSCHCSLPALLCSALWSLFGKIGLSCGITVLGCHSKTWLHPRVNIFLCCDPRSQIFHQASVCKWPL